MKMESGSTTFVRSVPLRERPQARAQGCFEFKKLVKNLPEPLKPRNSHENDHGSLSATKPADKWIEIRPDKKLIKKKESSGVAIQSSHLPALPRTQSSGIRKNPPFLNPPPKLTGESKLNPTLKRGPPRATILITPHNRKVPRIIRTYQNQPPKPNSSSVIHPGVRSEPHNLSNSSIRQVANPSSVSFRELTHESENTTTPWNPASIGQQPRPKNFEIRQSLSGSFRVSRPIILSGNQFREATIEQSTIPGQRNERKQILISRGSSAFFKVDTKPSSTPKPIQSLDPQHHPFQTNICDPNPGTSQGCHPNNARIQEVDSAGFRHSSSAPEFARNSIPETIFPPPPSQTSNDPSKSGSSDFSTDVPPRQQENSVQGPDAVGKPEETESQAQHHVVPDDPLISTSPEEQFKEQPGIPEPGKRKRGRPKKDPKDKAPPKPRKPKAPGEAKPRKKPKIVNKINENEENGSNRVLDTGGQAQSFSGENESGNSSSGSPPEREPEATSPRFPEHSSFSQPSTSSNSPADSSHSNGQPLEGLVLDTPLGQGEGASELELLEQWLTSRKDLIDAIATEDPFPDIKDMDDFVNFSDYSSPGTPESGGTLTHPPRTHSQASSSFASAHDMSQTMTEDHGYSHRQFGGAYSSEEVRPPRTLPYQYANSRQFPSNHQQPMIPHSQSVPSFPSGPIITVQNCHRCYVPVRTTRLMDHVLCHYGIDFGRDAPFYACQFCRYDSFDWSDIQDHSQTFHQVTGGFFDRCEAMKAACFPPFPQAQPFSRVSRAR